jgi:hypothetical protein
MKNWQVASILLLAVIPLYFYTEQASSSVVTFEEWRRDFGLTFSNEEDAFRKLIFVHNLNDIEKHNADGTQTYKKGVNQFTHLN